MRSRSSSAFQLFLQSMLSLYFLGFFWGNALGQPLYEQGQSLHSLKPVLLDGFGFAVASEGDSVLVGSPHAAGARGQMGKAFLFQRETGKILHSFLPPTPVGDDMFGLSVGLTDRYVIVGAPRGRGKLGHRSGMVAVFDRESGKLVRKFMSPNATASVFGHIIAIQGPWLAIGDPGANSSTKFDVGEVYVYEMATGQLVQKFLAPEAIHGKADGFGHALAFLGSTLAISAPLGGVEPIDHGTVFVFEVETGKLIRTLESPEPQTNEYFGWSLASDLDTLLVGALGRKITHAEAGAAYLFTHQGKFQKKFEAPHPQKGGHFGEAVALLEDFYVVAAPGDDTAGIDAGTVFVINTTTNQFQFTIPNPSKTTGAADLFGLSMHGDGAHLVVGAPYSDLSKMPDAGQVHQFYFQISTPTP